MVPANPPSTYSPHPLPPEVPGFAWAVVSCAGETRWASRNWGQALRQAELPANLQAVARPGGQTDRRSAANYPGLAELPTLPLERHVQVELPGKGTLQRLPWRGLEAAEPAFCLLLLPYPHTRLGLPPTPLPRGRVSAQQQASWLAHTSDWVLQVDRAQRVVQLSASLERALLSARLSPETLRLQDLVRLEKPLQELDSFFQDNLRGTWLWLPALNAESEFRVWPEPPQASQSAGGWWLLARPNNSSHLLLPQLGALLPTLALNPQRGWLVLDPAHQKVVEYNSLAYRMLAQDSPSLVGKTLHELLPRLQGEQPQMVLAPGPGNWRQLSVQQQHLHWKGRKWKLVQLVDCSREYEQGKSLALAQLALSHAPHGMGLLMPSEQGEPYHLAYMNPNLAELLVSSGLVGAPLTANNLREQVTPLDGSTSLPELDLAQSFEVVKGLFQLKTAHTDSVFEVVLTPWQPPDKNYPVWVLSVRDISAERSLAQDRARQAQERLSATVRAQESERTRLAHELHDGLGPQLASVKLLLSRMQRQLAQHSTPSNTGPAAEPAEPLQDLNQRLQEAYEMLDRATDDLRLSAHNLSPLLLEQQGLERGLQTFCHRMNQAAELHITYESHHLQDRFPDEIELGLYRIAQELVFNAIRHSQGQQVEVQLSQLRNRLMLIVQDNGQGFQQDAASGESQGLGLHSIRTRAELLGGELRMEATSGEGSSFLVSVPLPTPAAANGQPTPPPPQSSQSDASP